MVETVLNVVRVPVLESTEERAAGVDTYLQVIAAQTVTLMNQRNDIDILRRRLDASVVLVKSVGGGWDATELPKP